MIEKMVRDYLNNKMKIPAYTEKPDKPPEKYIIIEKTGGGTENLISDATISIQSYAESMYEASLLNETVKEKMPGMAEMDMVSKVTLNSNYNYSDTTRKQYRYQSVYDLIYFEE